MTSNFFITSITAILFGLCFTAVFVSIIIKLLFNNKKVIELTQAFQTNVQPEGKVLKKQTIGLSRILRYRNIATVCISSSGFYLSIGPLFGWNPTVLIPWDQIKKVQKTKLYGVEAFELLTGDYPYITLKVYPSIFSVMEPYIPRSAYVD